MGDNHVGDKHVGDNDQRYGGLQLRRGDRDGSGAQAPVWAGVARAGAATHVLTLQQDLDGLGFHLVGVADGTFGRRTEWAVREFQIYAGMARVARELPTPDSIRYVDNLSPVATGADRYSGPVSGVVDAATRRALGLWIERRWRCPVVVEAWNVRFGKPDTLSASNLWLHPDLPNPSPRIYVRDFTGYYDLPPGRDPDGLVVLGEYVRDPPWAGPRSVPPRHTWPEAELLPESLVGLGLDALNADQLSTYKVVRAVAEVECLGFFDSINAYDNAYLSQGPCHWTLGIENQNRSVSDGELCGYLAYLRHVDAAAFARAIGNFGVTIDADWVTSAGEASGAGLFHRSQRKYAGWVALQTADGSYHRIPQTASAAGEADYFRSWHWMYRFAMAGRTIEGYRRRMWDMARMRLRDVAATPWGAGVRGVSDGATAAPRPATLGDVLTSERARAIVLRWHIRYPAHVVTGGTVGDRLRHAAQRARTAASTLDWTADPRGWTGAHEAALLRGLRDEVAGVGGDLATTVDAVDRWPDWGANRRGYRLPATIGPLSEARGSFRLDVSGLPPAP